METIHLIVNAEFHRFTPIFFLYIGPESFLPLTSALAAFIGFLLMFWQRFVALVRRAWQFLTKR
jgi:hypothetical protein